MASATLSDSSVPAAHTAGDMSVPESLAPERSLKTRRLEEAQQACESLFHYCRPEIPVAQDFLEHDLALKPNGDLLGAYPPRVLN